MNEHTGLGTGAQPETADEVRTRRLVVVDDNGREVAALQSGQGVVELRLGEGESGIPCSVVLHAGEPEAGVYAAGVELWVVGNSVGGCHLTRVGERIELHRFGTTAEQGSPR